MSILEILGLVVVGVGAGLLAGLFGVGGGAIIVPALVVLGGLSQHMAQGTSLLVIVPTAAFGVVLHLRNGLVSVRSAALLASGGVVGALVGSALALHAPEAQLRLIFAAFLVVSGIRLILSGRTR